MKAITRDRFFRGAMAAAMLASLLVVAFAPPADATHDRRTLEVTPEVHSVPFGTNTTTLTAVLSSPATEAVNISFENEEDSDSGGDGDSTQSPDASCTIAADTNQCSITLQRGVGSDNWRVWINHDNIQGTEEADDAEGRLSNPETDCDQAQDDAEDCETAAEFNPFSPDDPDRTPTPGNARECGGLLTDPAQEPDCTDVVEVIWENEARAATTVDCDDSGPPDTERETNAPGQSETYTCTVRDQFGGTMSSQTIYGENESGVNDPDPQDGASYEQPDYSCSVSSTGSSCTVSVPQSEGENGTAVICWWISTPQEGATACADEPVGEAQQADGSDVGNDKADRTELTWEDPSSYTLDCTPETDVNPVGTAHRITCEVQSSNGQGVSNQQVDAEATGANDPDRSDSRLTPDFTCVTGADGKCSFAHTGAETGTTTYRAWIDTDRDDLTTEADGNEGQNEAQNPGATEPDRTDVVTKEWVAAPTTVTITPKSDSAAVGECNPFTVTATRGSGDNVTGVEGVTIDVEQRHQNSANQTANDEPKVEFCTPASGPNPSDVDTTRGDLGPNSAQENDRETPDNQGTAGGETVKSTNTDGQVTFGIKVSPANGSDGSGAVAVVAFFDQNDNDDPDASEPKDEATKTWTDASAADARTIDCQPATTTQQTGQSQVVTCTVENRAGEGVQGETVNFTTSGVGTISPSTATTDSQGRASTTATSSQEGTQTVTGTLADSKTGEPNADECERAANDPQGSPAGSCSDSSTIAWQSEPVGPQCSDGVDNDDDGQTDFPNDRGCESAEDDSESPDPQRTCPDFEGDSRNHIVGTEGDDTIQGTEGDDVICGLGGNDLIDGLGGNDLILGGDGNDSLRGGDGNDDLRGEAGKDELRGNGGNDQMSGGDQNDDLRGNAGDDVMRGESGFDVLRGGAGDDRGFGGSGNDTLQGFTGRDLLVGNAGNDTVKGAGGRDEIRGGKNDDVLSGGNGPDEIRGGPGSDVCAGGPGNNDVRGCER